jgi:hypothetical protein
MDERPPHRGTAAIGLILAVVAVLGTVIWLAAGPRRGTHITLYTSGSSILHVSGAVRGSWKMPVVSRSWSKAETDGTRGLNGRWIGGGACGTCELKVIGDYDPGTGIFITVSVEIHVPERPYIFWARQGECAVTVQRVDDSAAQGQLACRQIPTLVEGSNLAIDATGRFDLEGAQQQ